MSSHHNSPEESSDVGVLLLNSKLRPVHYNAEAADILGYPSKGSSGSLEAAIPIEIRTRLASLTASSVPEVVHLDSGRRRYRCRLFPLGSNADADARTQPRFLVLLEPESAQAIDITQWSDEFHLTIRERETVACLLKGFSTKEIAKQMCISPSTVKSFLKLVMIKVGASHRTGIVAKLFDRAS